MLFRSQPTLGTEFPIRARILFHTHLRTEDWQVVRELSCITGSRQAIKSLAGVAGCPWPRPVDDWTIHRCHCLTTDAQSLRALCGEESAAGAASKLSLHLKLSVNNNTDVHFSWAMQSNAEGDEPSFDLWALLSSGNSLQMRILRLHYSSVLEELLPGRFSPSFLEPFLKMPRRLAVNGAILLKKPSS